MYELLSRILSLQNNMTELSETLFNMKLKELKERKENWIITDENKDEFIVLLNQIKDFESRLALD